MNSAIEGDRNSVGNFPFAARVVYCTGVSGDDFWQVAKTHGGSAGVHFEYLIFTLSESTVP